MGRESDWDREDKNKISRDKDSTEADRDEAGKNGEVPCGTGKEGRPADGV